MRLIALVGVLLLVVFVPRLAKLCGVPAGRALWLGVLNPLVLFHFVSGAHNDALLMGLMVAGLVLVMERKPALGVVLVSLALLVKAPAALALVFIVPFWAQHLTGRWRLVRAAAAVGAISGSVVALVSWATGLGYGWIGALNTPGTVRNWLSASTLIGELFGFVFQAFGVGDDRTVMDQAIKVSRGIGGLIAIVVVLVLLARMERRGFVASLGLGLIAVVALSPVVQPWYLLWGFVLVAAGTSNLRTRTIVTAASAALAVVVMPKGGTVDVSAIIQAVLCAAAVAGAVVTFELLPGRTLGARAADAVPAPILGAPRRPSDAAPRTPVVVPDS
jgi:hypothetical protein